MEESLLSSGVLSFFLDSEEFSLESSQVSSVHEFEEAPVEESSQAKRTSARASSRNNIPTFEFFINNPICIFEKDRYIVGQVVNVSADESVLGEDGKGDLGKVEPISYDSVAKAYRVLGEKVGKAFSDGKQLL